MSLSILWVERSVDAVLRGQSTLRTVITGLTAIGVVLGANSTSAFASSNSVVWAKKNIEFASYSARGVSGYVEHGTTYMPIWYVLQALKKNGYTVSFNGKVLNITPAQGVTPNTTGIPIGEGNLSIQIAGQTVKKVVSEVRPDPAGGVKTQYIPIYYMQQILSALSYYNAWNGTNWTGQPINVTMQGSDTLPEGQLAAYSLQFENPDNTLFIPNDAVTWSVSGNDGAQIDKNTGIFTANSPGVYDVTGEVDGFQWTKQVSVYGTAVGVQLSASNTSLISDGATTSTVTVKAIDGNGNLVSNFTGSILLCVPATSGGQFLGGITSGSLNQVPVYLYNGVGTATLTAPVSTTDTNEQVTSSNLTSTSQTLPDNVQYGALNVSYTAPTVAKIAVTPSTTSLNSNDYSQNVKLTLEDANGNPLTNGSLSGMSVNVTISGPASFASGVSVQTTTEYLYPSQTGVTLPIYALTGQSGPVTVTATGDGVSGQATLYSNPIESNRSLSVIKSQGTLTSSFNIGSATLPAGTAFTLYTVTSLDGNDNPVPQADTLWITDNSVSAGSTGTTGTATDALTYYSAVGGQPNSLLPWASTNTYSLSTSAVTGKAQFVVFNTGNAPANTSITIRDLTTNATATTTN